MADNFDLRKYLMELKTELYQQTSEASQKSSKHRDTVQEGRITDDYESEEALALQNMIAALQIDVATKKKLTDAVLAFAQNPGRTLNTEAEGKGGDLEAEKSYVEGIIQQVKTKYPRLSEYMHLYKRINPEGGALLGYGIIYQNFPAYGAEMGKPPMKIDIIDFPAEDKVHLGRFGYQSKAPYRQQVASDPGRSISVPSASVSIGDGRSDIAQALFVISKPKSM